MVEPCFYLGNLWFLHFSINWFFNCGIHKKISRANLHKKIKTKEYGIYPFPLHFFLEQPVCRQIFNDSAYRTPDDFPIMK